MNNISVNDTIAGAAATGEPVALPLDAGSLLVLFTTLIVFCGPLFVLFPPFPPSKSDALTETHNKLGLEPRESNLRDYRRSGPGSGSGPGPTTAAAAKVESLFVYPVKSCRGIELSRAKVIPTGLEFDRLFTLAQLKSPFPVSTSPAPGVGADEDAAARHRWEFITQRQFPLLATVEVDLWSPDLAKIKGFRDVTAGSSGEVFMVLRFPWRPDGLLAGLWASFAAKCTRGWRARPVMEVMLPAGVPDEGEIAAKGYAWDQVRVWRDEVTALNMASDLPEELRLYLGVSNKLALFRVDPQAGLREVHKCAPAREEAGYQPVVGFQDSYPVHIMNLASVQDLETKVSKDEELKELSPRRFRANIFVSGLPPYDEDDWRKLKLRPAGSQELEETTFDVSCRTTRCKLPNVNQETGEKHRAEPDKTLRSQREIDAGAPKTGCLGMQMTPLFENTESPETFIEVGMSIEILERGEHMYKKQ